jgi:hypothetical protein
LNLRLALPFDGNLLLVNDGLVILVRVGLRRRVACLDLLLRRFAVDRALPVEQGFVVCIGTNAIGLVSAFSLTLTGGGSSCSSGSNS